MIENDLLYQKIGNNLEFFSTLRPKLDASYSYDLIIAHEVIQTGLVGLYLAQESQQKPLKILDCVEYPVFSERTSPELRALGKSNPVSDTLTAYYAANLANLYDMTIATSKGQLDILQQHGFSKNGKVLRNCSLYKDYAPSSYLKDNFGITDADVVLLYINRAYPNAGAELIIESLPHLPDNFKLVFLGDIFPSIADSINSLINHYDLHKRVFVTGLVDPSLLHGITCSAHICLSLLEPVIDNHRTCLPNRIFNSIMARKPVVVFKGTAMAKFVEDNKAGIALSSLDPSIISQEVFTLANNQIPCVNHLETLVSTYSWEVESQVLAESITTHSPRIKNALVVACKSIQRNERVYRIIETLTSLDISVDVLAFKSPFSSITHNKARYFSLSSPDAASHAVKPRNESFQRRQGQKQVPSAEGSALVTSAMSTSSQERIKRNNNPQKICCFASIPERTETLPKVVASIYDQFDRICIYLNNYDSVPDFLLNDKKIMLSRSQEHGDLGANGKFFFLDHFTAGDYYFTIDDDFIYPHDYAARMIQCIQKYHHRFAVTVHGSIFPPRVDWYFQRLSTFPYNMSLATDTVIALAGTGTLAFTLGAPYLCLDDLMRNIACDALFSAACKAQNIPIVSISRSKGWLTHLDLSALDNTYWIRMLQNDGLRTSIVSAHAWDFPSHSDMVLRVLQECFPALDEETVEKHNLDRDFITCHQNQTIPKKWRLRNNDVFKRTSVRFLRKLLYQFKLFSGELSIDDFLSYLSSNEYREIISEESLDSHLNSLDIELMFYEIKTNVSRSLLHQFFYRSSMENFTLAAYSRFMSESRLDSHSSNHLQVSSFPAAMRSAETDDILLQTQNSISRYPGPAHPLDDLRQHLFSTQKYLKEARETLAEERKTFVGMRYNAGRKLRAPWLSRVLDRLRTSFVGALFQSSGSRHFYKTCAIIRNSQLFDFDYYTRENPDVITAGLDPLEHWVRYGWRENRNPNRYFDTAYYLQHSPDVQESGINPLVHFIMHGSKEMRDPGPLFSVSSYLENYQDVHDSGLNPLAHYLIYGEREGRSRL